MKRVDKPKVIGNPHFLTDEKAQARQRELVEIVQDLINKRGCNLADIATSAGIQRELLSHYVRNTRVVTEKTLAKIRNVADRPITPQDKIDFLTDEIKELKGLLSETLKTLQKTLDVKQKAEQVLAENEDLKKKIKTLQEKLK